MSSKYWTDEPGNGLNGLTEKMYLPQEALTSYYTVLNENAFLMDTAGTVRVTINNPVKYAVADYQNYINTFLVAPFKQTSGLKANNFGEMQSAYNCSDNNNNCSNSSKRSGEQECKAKLNGTHHKSHDDNDGNKTAAAGLTKSFEAIPRDPLPLSTTFFFYNQPRLHCLYNAPYLDNCSHLLHNCSKKQARSMKLDEVDLEHCELEFEEEEQLFCTDNITHSQLKQSSDECVEKLTADHHSAFRNDDTINDDNNIDSTVNHFINLAEMFGDSNSSNTTNESFTCLPFIPPPKELVPPSAFAYIDENYMANEAILLLKLFNADSWFSLKKRGSSALKMNSFKQATRMRGCSSESCSFMNSLFGGSSSNKKSGLWSKLKWYANKLTGQVSEEEYAGHEADMKPNTATNFSSKSLEQHQENEELHEFDYEEAPFHNWVFDLTADPAKICGAPSLYTISLLDMYQYDDDDDNNEFNIFRVHNSHGKTPPQSSSQSQSESWELYLKSKEEIERAKKKWEREHKATNNNNDFGGMNDYDSKSDIKKRKRDDDYDSDSDDDDDDSSNDDGGNSSWRFDNHTIIMQHDFEPVRLIAVLAQCSAIPLSVDITVEMLNYNGTQSSAQYMSAQTVSITFFCLYVFTLVLFCILCLPCCVRCCHCCPCWRHRHQHRNRSNRHGRGAAGGGSERSNHNNSKSKHKKSKKNTKKEGNNGRSSNRRHRHQMNDDDDYYDYDRNNYREWYDYDDDDDNNNSTSESDDGYNSLDNNDNNNRYYGNNNSSSHRAQKTGNRWLRPNRQTHYGINNNNEEQYMDVEMEQYNDNMMQSAEAEAHYSSNSKEESNRRSNNYNSKQNSSRHSARNTTSSIVRRDGRGDAAMAEEEDFDEINNNNNVNNDGEVWEGRGERGAVSRSIRGLERQRSTESKRRPYQLNGSSSSYSNLSSEEYHEMMERAMKWGKFYFYACCLCMPCTLRLHKQWNQWRKRNIVAFMYPPLQIVVGILLLLKCIVLLLNVNSYTLARWGHNEAEKALLIIVKIVNCGVRIVLFAVEMLVAMGWGVVYGKWIPTSNSVMVGVGTTVVALLHILTATCTSVNDDNAAAFTVNEISREIMGTRCLVFNYLDISIYILLHFFNLWQLVRLTSNLSSTCATTTVYSPFKRLTPWHATSSYNKRKNTYSTKSHKETKKRSFVDYNDERSNSLERTNSTTNSYYNNTSNNNDMMENTRTGEQRSLSNRKNSRSNVESGRNKTNKDRYNSKEREGKYKNKSKNNDSGRTKSSARSNSSSHSTSSSRSDNRDEDNVVVVSKVGKYAREVELQKTESQSDINHNVFDDYDNNEMDQVRDNDNTRKRSVRGFVNNTSSSNKRSNNSKGNVNNDIDDDNNNKTSNSNENKKNRHEGQLANGKSKRRGRGFSHYSRNQAAQRFARANRIALIAPNRSINENAKHLHSASPASSQEEVEKLNIFLRYHGMRIPFTFLPFWNILFIGLSFLYFQPQDRYMLFVFTEMEGLYLLAFVLLSLRYKPFFY